MTTLSVNRMSRDLRCGLPAEPVRSPFRAMLVALFIMMIGAVSVEVPASVMTGLASFPVAELGITDELLSSAANSDSRADTRELVQCHRHAYRHHVNPATCELLEP